MLPEERYHKIVEYLKVNRMIRIGQMTELFHISVETARRDLSFLEKKGIVRKVYGGAALVQSDTREAANAVRMQEALEEKRAIARKCAAFIDDGDQLLIGAGTTTMQVARALKEKKDLTVITTSVYVAEELLDTDFTLYIIGGRIRHDESAISGTLSLYEMEQLTVGKAILGMGGITAKNGLSDYQIEEALLRRKIIERADESIIVADSRKFGKDVLTHICAADEVSMIVTDRGISDDQAAEMRQAGANLILA